MLAIISMVVVSIRVSGQLSAGEGGREGEREGGGREGGRDGGNIGYTTPTRWFSGYTLRVHSMSSVYTKPLSGCSVTGLYHRSHRDQRNRCS